MRDFATTVPDETGRAIKLNRLIIRDKIRKQTEGKG